MSQAIKKNLSEKDEVLRSIISQIDLPDNTATGNIFHDLMSCIIEQQIHYRSTKKTFQRMLDAAKLELLTVENFELFEEKGIRDYKLATSKAETLLRVLSFFQKNNIDWQAQSDTEIRKIFKGIKGIGTWTVDMLLLYSLDRSDIFPVDDYHLNLIMTKCYPIDKKARVKAQMRTIAAEWAPQRSAGTRYLLAWKDALRKGTV